MSQPLTKITVERIQRALLELASKPGNDVCADCKVRNPRWASHNLGIFICVNCASIHRKIGTHITKVKSLTLDSWTKEQVENMKQNGNLKSNNLYNPDEIRHPPPTNLEDTERDSDLERYIRAKYEYKRYINRPALVATYLGPPSHKSASRRSSPVSGPKPAPSPSSTRSRDRQTPLNAEKAKAPSQPAQTPQSKPVSQPVSTQPPQSQPPPPQIKKDSVWDDLVSLQTSASESASLPLQYQVNTPSPISMPGRAFLEPGLTMNAGYSPMLTTHALQNVTANPTGLVVPGQGQFQPQLQQPMGFQPIIVQPTANGNTLGLTYPMGFGGGQQIVPPQHTPSPSLQPAYLQQQQQQQPMSYSPQPTAFQGQAMDQSNPFAFQTQAFQPQMQQFPSQIPFIQTGMPFAQPQQVQMFTPTGQFGAWSQSQTGYQGQQWGGM